MENYQLLSILGVNLVVFISFMGTVIALHIHLSKQTNQQINAIHQQITAIHQEMKDFHGRLCAIEERRK